MKAATLALAALVPILFNAPASAHEGRVGPSNSASLGAVSFETSCRPQLQQRFDRAVALMHSFAHEEAEREFKQIAQRDPSCAMAYWGEAMTHFHQFLDPPTPVDLEAGRLALQQADAAAEKTPREAAYIAALHRFFDDYKPETYLKHTVSYAEAMATLASNYSNDVEAQVFYALALLASDAPDDQSLARSKRAVSILYPIFRRHPDHPGVAHYIIHACDNPPMAQQGLEAARRYASIAPAISHALHMPSHIFSRLGLWQDDVRSNLAAKSAAQKAGLHQGAESRLHAMEFLEYAWLQTGQVLQAQSIVQEARSIRQSDVDPRYVDYYPTVQARFPALLAIETQNWAGAAALTPAPNAPLFAQSLTLLANVMAAAYRHDPAAARETAQTLDRLQAGFPATPPGSPEATLADEIHAWSAFAQDDLPGALALLRPLSELQTQIGKSEVELPAREMLAQMLLLRGQASAALHEYQGVLVSDPNRFNALLGAAQAAVRSGQTNLARRYAHTLFANCTAANGRALARLQALRTLLTAGKAGALRSLRNPASRRTIALA